MPQETFSLRVKVDTKGADKALSGLGASMAKVAGAAGFGLLVKNVVQAGMKFQDLRTQLETVTGSADRAAAAFKQIQDFSAKTPYQVENVTRAFTNLAAKGFAPTAENMRSLGDMAAAFGTDITQAVQAVTQAAFGEAEMLKQYGIIMRQQGDTVKLTYKGVTQEIEKDSAKIFSALTELANVNFAGGMERQSKTLSGSLSTLKDNWTILMDAIANGTGGLDGITKAVQSVTKAIQYATEIVQNWDAAWNQLAAEMTRSITQALASVNRAIARWISDMTLKLANAPWIVRAILDPAGGMVKSGAALASAFADTADEIERFGGDLVAVFEEAAQAALVVDDLEVALDGLGAQATETGNEIDSVLEKLRELANVRISAGDSIDWKDQGDAFARAIKNGIVDAGSMIERILRDAADSGIKEGSISGAQAAQPTIRDLFSELFDEKYWEGVGGAIGSAVADALISGNIDELENAFARIGRSVGSDIGFEIGAALGGPVGAAIGTMLGEVAGDAIGKAVGGFLGDAMVALGLAPDPKRVLGSFAIGPGGFSGLGGTAEAQAAGQQMLDWIESIFDSLNAAIGGTVELTKNMEIEVKRNGEAILKLIDTATGAVIFEKAFKSVQEATEAGLVNLLSTSILNMDDGPLKAAFGELLGRVAELGVEGLAEAFESLAKVSQQLGMMGDETDRLRTTMQAGLGQFDQLRQEIEALGLSAEAAAPLLADLEARQRRYNSELKRNVISELAGWAKQLGVGVRIQRKAAILEAKVQAKKLEIELKMLGMWERWGGLVRELRQLSIEAARGIGKATQDVVSLFGNTSSAVDQFSGSVKTAGRVLGDVTDALGDAIEEIVPSSVTEREKRLAHIASLAENLAGGDSVLSPIEDILKRYADAVAWARAYMGTGGDLTNALDDLRTAFEIGWQKIIDSMKAGLQDYLDSLLLGDLAPGTPLEKATEAAGEFERLLGLALGGDADALAQLQEAAERALSLGASTYGTSSSTFMALFDMITQGLAAALGTDYAAPADATVEALNTQTAVMVDSLTQLRDTVKATSDAERNVLLDIRRYTYMSATAAV